MAPMSETPSYVPCFGSKRVVVLVSTVGGFHEAVRESPTLKPEGWSGSTQASNAPGQMDVSWHDRDAFRVNRAQVCVFKQVHQVRLGRLLQRQQSLALPPPFFTSTEVFLCYFSHLHTG